MPVLECVVVLYRRTPEQSAALASLAGIARSRPELAALLSLLVYDNSPQPAPQPFPWHAGPAGYVHDPRNPGLAAAYNLALRRASEAGLGWLLLLDQDTAVTAGYLEELTAALARPDQPRVCAYLPRLRQGGRVISPHRPGPLRTAAVAEGFTGVPRRRLTGFNSGACLRVAALEAIGGFPADFPLDYLDHAVFHRLARAGGCLSVLAAELEHRHSLASLETEMTPGRYARLLEAEWRYVAESRGAGGRAYYRLQLLRRVLAQRLRHADGSYARLTLASLRRGPRS